MASATFVILLVCFAMYQFGQPDRAQSADSPSMQPARQGARSPEVPDELADVPSAETGGATVGPGQNIHMTLYPRSGDQAPVELTVTSWTPVEGRADEFLLKEPDVRMRTSDGHAVRVTAQRGILEAQRKSGGGLDPTRGSLSGGVVIQYDRLTETDRANLPEAARGKIDPADVVRIEVPDLDFDLEYSKLLMPGRLLLTSSDANLEAEDVEVRFDEMRNRVRQLRIGGGGRIELRERGPGVGLALSALDAQGDKRVTVADWLRATIQSRLAPPTTETKTETSEQETTSPRPIVTESADGIPVFDPRAAKAQNAEPPVRYYARFEGGIDVAQREGDAVQSSLTADMLEIVRAFTEEANRAAMAQPAAGQPGQTAVVAPTKRVNLAWHDRLLVEACEPDDPRCGSDERSTVSATGSPARIRFSQGSATCSKLTFVPDGSKIWLRGSDSQPAVVNFANEGVIRGRTIFSERREGQLIIHVDGPGSLTRKDPPAIDGTEAAMSMIEFTESLDAQGRVVNRTELDAMAGQIVSGSQRVLDKAEFVGAVKVREGDTGMDADAVTLTFADGGTRAKRQAIDRIVGDGHVTMTHGEDQVECRKIDLSLTTHTDGRSVPRVASAWGDVSARQGTRTIEARDRLIVDFEMVTRPAEAFDAARALTTAIDAGLTPKQIEDEVRRHQQKNKTRTEPGVSRLRAYGAVTISDSTDELHLIAEEIDAEVSDGREIETAFIRGANELPASVRFDNLTVAGEEITIDVPDQWAQVPGPGRLTLLSRRDLDGRRLRDPIPISVTWNERMEYQGRENRSLFVGNVHMTSRDTTTFDCGQLRVDFEDAQPTIVSSAWDRNWGVFQPVVNEVAKRMGRDTSQNRQRFSKEVASILATGQASAVTSEYDAAGTLLNRSSIRGPKLSANLRSDASKVLIEGPGRLLLEDMTTPPKGTEADPAQPGGLLTAKQDSGPSNTLIQWKDRMWYDFSIEQTRFDGDVRLTYLSGTELAKIREIVVAGSAEIPPGRRTTLRCEELTVDFQDRDERSSSSSELARLPEDGHDAQPVLASRLGSKRNDVSPDQRIGGLSAGRLQQFEAKREVFLDDTGEGIQLTAERVVFWKESDLLGVYGTDTRKAHIIQRVAGQLPHQVSVKRLFYNLRTKQIEIHEVDLRTR